MDRASHNEIFASFKHNTYATIHLSFNFEFLLDARSERVTDFLIHFIAKELSIPNHFSVRELVPIRIRGQENQTSSNDLMVSIFRSTGLPKQKAAEIERV